MDIHLSFPDNPLNGSLLAQNGIAMRFRSDVVAVDTGTIVFSQVLLSG